MALSSENVQTPEIDHAIVLCVGRVFIAVYELCPVLAPLGIFLKVSLLEFVRRACSGTFRRLGIDPLLPVFVRRFTEFLTRQKFGISAQQNICAASSHIGGDGACADASGLSHDQGFAIMLLGIEDVGFNIT